MDSRHAVVFNIEWTPAKPKPDWSASKKAEWAKNRRFYSCNAAPGELDVAHYTADDEKVDRPSGELLREQAAERLDMNLSDRIPDKSEARRIDDYMTRFNTLGAFNMRGAMTEREFDEWIAGAQKAPSTIWHGVLSLSTEQSKLVGYEDMEKLVRQTFGAFLKNAGFDPDNVALLAALHENTENKHIHLTFYEKEPIYIDKYGNRNYRKQYMLPQKAFDEFRMSASAYLDENKRLLSKYRDATVKALRGVPTDKELYIALEALADKLPKSGRLQYCSKNIEPFCKDVDAVVRMLLRKSPEVMNAHRQTLSEIARRGNALAETSTKSDYVKRLTAEYKSRLGNVVLGMVKNFRSNIKSAVRGAPQTRKQYKASARRRREHGAQIIRSAMRFICGDEKSVQADFRRNLEKIEREMEFERIVSDANKHNRS